LVDFGGYVITTHEDLEDIKVVEISDANSDNNNNINVHNRLYSSSYDENSIGISNNTNNININHYNITNNITTNNNNDNDDWAQHLDLTGNTNNANTINIDTNLIVNEDNTFIHNTHIDAVKDVSYGQNLVRLESIADVWIVPSNDYCTTIINSDKNNDKNNEKNDIDECEKLNDDDKIIQPCHRLTDTNFNICTRCTRYEINKDL